MVTHANHCIEFCIAQMSNAQLLKQPLLNKVYGDRKGLIYKCEGVWAQLFECRLALTQG